MTSGHFTSYPVDKIWVNREKRQRRDITLDELLTESIRANGLIHPLVITREGELIAGERRWTSVKHLGWTDVSVQFTDELDPTQLHLIELEENIRRKDLTWQEECDAIEQYHKLRGEITGSRTLEDTARELNLTPSTVQQRIEVSEAIKKNPELAKAPLYSTARNMLKRQQERAKASTLRDVAKVFDDSSPTTEAKEPATTIPLLHADFTEWAPGYTGEKFNLIHCDFPYGIDANNQQQGNNVLTYGTYEDSPDVYFSLLDTLEAAMQNVVADSAHLIFWYSMDYHTFTLERLTGMGWSVNPFPLIWLKSDNTGLLPDPNRGPRRIYETAFFASRGDRKIVRAVSNAFAHPGKDKSIHMSEKPREMLRHFMRMVVDEYTTMLDPTCGSGNAVKVADTLGANKVLGLERDETFHQNACAAYNEEGL